MKRAAVIIESGFEGQKPLKGVRIDSHNMLNYFSSDVGGGFIPDVELFYFNEPSIGKIGQIKRFLDRMDLSLIYFSGHGRQQNGRDYLKINPFHEIPVRQLLTSAKRQIIISDSCRKGSQWVNYTGIGDVASSFSKRNLEIARELHKHYAILSPVGHVFTFGTEANLLSEDTEDGGVFTNWLLSTVNKWTGSNSSYMLNMGDVIQLTYDQILAHGEWQKPSQYANNRFAPLAIPFAINPELYLRNTTRRIGSQYIGVGW